MRPSRISNKFQFLAAEGRPGLVTFLTAGDPNSKMSLQTLLQLPAAGADVIELGMPFSDPMADGPVIQASSQRALVAGANMNKTLAMVAAFREKDQETPLVLMGYYNPIYVYGVKKFISDAESVGVDGLIVVDLPPEESELRGPLRESNINLIYLVAPTTNDERLPKVVEYGSGFIYYVSIVGITGTKTAVSKSIKPALTRLRRHTDLPIAVGFGIKTPAQAAEIAQYADAAVVGSALVSCVENNLDKKGEPTSACVTSVLDLVGQIAEGVRSVAKNVQENASE